MTIGQVANRRVGVETIRFYEREGLLVKPNGGHPDIASFSPDVVVEFIHQESKTAGILIEGNPRFAFGESRFPSDEATLKSTSMQKSTKSTRGLRDLKRMRGSARPAFGCLRRKGPVGDCPLLVALEASRN